MGEEQGSKNEKNGFFLIFDRINYKEVTTVIKNQGYQGGGKGFWEGGRGDGGGGKGNRVG